MAFSQLKEAMSSPPVLGLSDFSKVIVMKCDTLGVAIRVVLMQDDKSLADFSQALKVCSYQPMRMNSWP